MSEKAPSWFPETRDFCRTAGIKIVAWGPNLLTVEAKSPEHAKEIAALLASLGFKSIPNEDNDFAGLLDLSRNPELVHAKIASFDISRRLWYDKIEPLIWVLLAIVLLLPSTPHFMQNYPPRIRLPFAIVMAALFFWEFLRIWGWRTELLRDGLRIRRSFRWSTLPWNEMCTVESRQVARRNQEIVIVKMTSGATEHIGTFSFSFARNLRDRLRSEITQRTGRQLPATSE